MKFSYDDRYLYVAANVTMFEPAKISRGSAWRKDDGVEICIAGKTPGGEHATFVIRGYPNGTWQSTAVAGAPTKVTERLGRELRFSAKTLRGRGGRERGWCGAVGDSIRWALGLRPATGLKVPFNMGVFCAEFGEWHCWEGDARRELASGSSWHSPTPIALTVFSRLGN